MIESAVIQYGKTVALNFKGSLTIQNALLLRDFLLNIPDQGDIIIIGHDEADEIDLSWLQLIVSLHKSAAKSGKTIKLTNSDLFNTLVTDSGFQSCKWITCNSDTETAGVSENE
jgi:anti-anti-sigma regulatory factor